MIQSPSLPINTRYCYISSVDHRQSISTPLVFRTSDLFSLKQKVYIMTTMKAIVMVGDAKAQVVTDRPLPKLRDRYVLVKTKAVALNPTDWKHIAKGNIPGLLSGCDFAGVVEEVGTGYSKEWKVGDRIAGLSREFPP